MSMQEMEKPHIPATPSVEVGISLGSNLGERITHLRDAVQALRAVPATKLLTCSPVYETEPVGVKPEYRDLPYLNTVVLLSTTLSAQNLSAHVHEIEARQGRMRQADRFAPRTIDIDILYVGQIRQKDPELTLPHPRWAQRRFVLQPLCDVRPGLIIPGSTQTVAEHLAALPPAQEAVERIPDTLLS